MKKESQKVTVASQTLQNRSHQDPVRKENQKEKGKREQEPQNTLRLTKLSRMRMKRQLISKVMANGQSQREKNQFVLLLSCFRPVFPNMSPTQVLFRKFCLICLSEQPNRMHRIARIRLSHQPFSRCSFSSCMSPQPFPVVSEVLDSRFFKQFQVNGSGPNLSCSRSDTAQFSCSVPPKYPAEILADADSSFDLSGNGTGLDLDMRGLETISDDKLSAQKSRKHAVDFSRMPNEMDSTLAHFHADLNRFYSNCEVDRCCQENWSQGRAQSGGDSSVLCSRSMSSADSLPEFYACETCGVSWDDSEYVCYGEFPRQGWPNLEDQIQMSQGFQALLNGNHAIDFHTDFSRSALHVTSQMCVLADEEKFTEVEFFPPRIFQSISKGQVLHRRASPEDMYQDFRLGRSVDEQLDFAQSPPCFSSEDVRHDDRHISAVSLSDQVEVFLNDGESKHPARHAHPVCELEPEMSEASDDSNQ